MGSFWCASGCLGEALGSSRGALWSSLACFRDVSGSLLEAFADSDVASEAEKVKMLKLLYLSCENKLLEVPTALELEVLSSPKRVLEAKQASGEHAGR